jgi:hypothetical protein
MISLHEFKKLLGKAADGLSDVEIESIRELEYRIADAAFEMWIRERKGSPPGHT